MATRVNGSQISGTCKFWNAIKGFGFIVPEDGGADIFVSQHDLVTGDTRFRALTAGQRVECKYTIGEDGKALAKNVTGPGGSPVPSFKDMFSAKREIESAKPRDPNKSYGVVKWFDTTKKHGFITPDDGDGTDVFMHYTECLKGIVPQTGDEVEFVLKTDRTGKLMAGEVKNKTQHTAGGRPMQPGMNPAMMQQMGGAPMQMQQQVFQQQQGYGQAAPTYGRKTGVVKFFNADKGYGFIFPDIPGPEIHVHKTGVMGGVLEDGQAVEYEEQFHKGKMQAVLVQKSSGAPAAVGMDQQQQFYDPASLNAANPRYY